MTTSHRGLPELRSSWMARGQLNQISQALSPHVWLRYCWRWPASGWSQSLNWVLSYSTIVRERGIALDFNNKDAVTFCLFQISCVTNVRIKLLQHSAHFYPDKYWKHIYCNIEGIIAFRKGKVWLTQQLHRIPVHSSHCQHLLASQVFDNKQSAVRLRLSSA